MAFLEGLANPITTKEAETDESLDGVVGKSEKVTTTPLVQFLKDRKASKNKDAAAKAAKKQEIQTARTKSARETSKDTSSSKESSNSPEDVKKKGKDPKVDKTVEKVAKETVKILNRQVAANATIQVAQGSAEGPPGAKLDVSKIPSRQRSTVVAAHIRMLQRDLGLSPAQAHRQVRRDTADAQKAERAAATDANAGKTAEPKDAASPQTPQTPLSPAVPTAPKGSTAQAGRRNRGKLLETEVNKAASPSSTTPASAGPSTPVILLKKPETPQSPLAPKPSTPVGPASQSTKSTPAAITRKPAVIAVPSAGATQAFVKHANPSQGVTEPLLKEAMEKFGAISMVEIDKKKGFAYVDFVEPDGLRKAMAANPISVAQGTVQVMQRKGTALPPEKKAPPQAPQAPSRGGRGGGRGGTLGRRGGRGGRGAAQHGVGGDAAKQPAPASASASTGPAIPTGPSAK
jgi:regulator of nonsense transcripts 3